MRNLSTDKYGKFDFILCLGILYHLNTPDVFDFGKNISECCNIATIFDTHFSLKASVQTEFQGKKYWGKIYTEFKKGISVKHLELLHWTSLDNSQSFWFTKPSLLNFIMDSGFGLIFEALLPFSQSRLSDRIILAAYKNKNNEEVRSIRQTSWSEQSKQKPHISQQSILKRIIHKIQRLVRR